MKTPNERRRQVLSFIQSRVEVDGCPPTLEEIANACGFASRSAAQKHVRALESTGDLQVIRGKSRSARPKVVKPELPGAVQLFEISSRDIADLSDVDLRILVARLCKARLADAGLPPAAVTWGGDQRAPDGGIDVRIQLSEQESKSAHFSRNVVCYQVKATKMGSREIQKEMCPGGLLRPAIRELIRDHGAYIIATSDSAADGEYKKRVTAMRLAAESESGHEHAEFDYYDARRLADWTNEHPGVVAWVRSELGRPLQGWQPHGQWANTIGGKSQRFLPDDKHRLTDPHDRERSFPLIDGLVHARQILGKGGNSVRLTGLSGVGKTRFAQAIFEESAAPEPLSPGLAVYTDTADSPNPSPSAVLNELLASRRHAILIVDNCGSQLHKQLTARCKVSDRISLLTIEYDIRENLPLETNVFQLESGSPELIEKVVGQQFPQISQVNLRTIAEFADGNSRVAVALANTMDSNESLAGLDDTELLDRLFWLGKEVQHELKVAAEACALLYSFDVEDSEGELSQLAALAGESALLLYRRVNDLQQRGLAQRRGRWRAVLPHAIANTLAHNALNSIPLALIEQKLVIPQDRLLRSFSRRLGYLHTSDTAVGIVRKWLANDGLLGDLAGLSPLLVEVLINIAPVDPAATLQAIKRTVIGARAVLFLTPSSVSRSLVRVVRSIAFDKDFFEECLDVLVEFARAEPEDTKYDPTRSVISSLFSIYFSGTHASTPQRGSWIRRAMKSDDVQLQAIGLMSLNSALECYNISSNYSFEFGARVRDYGAYPTGDSAKAWFEAFIELTLEVATIDSPLAERARDLLAQHFRSLWTVAGMADALVPAVVRLLKDGWESGWLAIRHTIRLDRDGMSANDLNRLLKLETLAKPQTLVGRVKAVVLNGNSSAMDFADGESDSNGHERSEQAARVLGELVAADEAAFLSVLPLVVTNEQGRQWMFGAGLASKTPSLKECWNTLVDAFKSTPEDQQNIQVLRGFLNGAFERDRATFEVILDGTMDDESLLKWVPVLQLSAPLNEPGTLRLLKTMDDPAVPAWTFSYLSFGRATRTLKNERLAHLLQRLSIKPDGLDVAINILYMHIHGNPEPMGAQLNDVACNLIANAPFAKNNHRLDHELAVVIEKFLVAPSARPAAERVLSVVRKGLCNFSLSRYDLTNTLAALFKTQPKLSLDMLVGDEADDEEFYSSRRMLTGGRRASALAGIPIKSLLEWCREGSPERWERVARLASAFESGAEKDGRRWSKQVLALLKHAPQPIAVAMSLVECIEPTSFSGSRADVLRQSLPLLDQLAEILGKEHADKITRWKNDVMQTIEREVRRELDEHRIGNERFE